MQIRRYGMDVIVIVTRRICVKWLEQNLVMKNGVKRWKISTMKDVSRYFKG